MRANGMTLAIGLLSVMLIGCRTPPPPRVPVPSESDGNPYTTYQHDERKPLPPSATQAQRDGRTQSQQQQITDPVVAIPPGPPPVSQRYVDAYDRVGRPRMMVLVDRPDALPRSLVAGDYDVLERVIRDTLSAHGQVLVVAPLTVREQIDQQQVDDINAGRADALADAGAKLRADVLVQVRAPPSGTGGDTQLTATARNTRDNQQLATAAAALGPSPQRRQIDFAGRLLGERLVDELAAAWERLAEQRPAPDAATAPATQPSTQP